MMARIAYLRVSSQDQSLDRQEDALRQFAPDRIFSDKGSGKSIADRPGLKALLDFIREGDTLYVESISRLARSTSDLLQIVKLLDTKAVALVSLM
jgi:DNA invertase Pin-like site-specific DNA recombinase